MCFPWTEFWVFLFIFGSNWSFVVLSLKYSAKLYFPKDMLWQVWRRLKVLLEFKWKKNTRYRPFKKKLFERRRLFERKRLCERKRLLERKWLFERKRLFKKNCLKEKITNNKKQDNLKNQTIKNTIWKNNQSSKKDKKNGLLQLHALQATSILRFFPVLWESPSISCRLLWAPLPGVLR